MAKKVRFPLQMNGVNVRTLEELRENFDVESVLAYYANGKLATWLRDRYYDNEATLIEEIKSDDNNIVKKICNILQLDFNNYINACNAETDVEFIKRRREKIDILCQFKNSDFLISKVDTIAFNQDDLLDILDQDITKTVYLCGGDFDIPLTVKNITYIGLDDPVVLLRAYDNVDFSALNLDFIDIYYGWNTSNITSLDKLYRAETLMKLGKKREAIKILTDVALTHNPRAEYLLYKASGSVDKSLISDKKEVCFNVENKCVNEIILKVLRKLSALNDDIAMFSLGKCFYFGYGVESDRAKAVEWYSKSAEHGNQFAQNNLGCCFDDEENYEKAVEWFKKSADQDNSIAQENLGRYFFYGYGVEKNYEEAVEWYRKSAKQGSENSQKILGDCFFYGNGVEKNYEEAVEWYRKSAEQGNIDSQRQLANCYYQGTGIQKNIELSKEMYEKLANQGDYGAQLDLAGLYDTEKEYEKALNWYQRCLKNPEMPLSSESLIAFIIGVYYEEGRGIEQNYQVAVEWFKKSAEKEYASAQSHLAECYYRGKGVEKNYEKAVEYFKKVPDDEYAQYVLGWCYEHGQGVNVDLNEAIKWYKKAAGNGETNAQKQLNELGVIY